MNLSDKFIHHLQTHFSGKNVLAKKWLLAISGGVDSVVLCDLVFKANIDFAVAHCNFQLRGDESVRDENFVRELANKYAKQFYLIRFDTTTYAEQNRKSVQVAAREMRYDWFYKIVNGELPAENKPVTDPTGEATLKLENFPALIVTAHHANDNIETLLMNFFKGTGISGLHGILPLQNKILRPLLPFKKEEILAYAREQQLAFVEDSSNLTDKYTRNYFRQHIIPLLKEIYPQVEDNLLHNIDRFTEVEMMYRQSVEQHKKKLLEYRGNEVHIPVLKLARVQPLRSIVHEIIKDFGFSSMQVDEVIALLESDSGRYVNSATHQVLKNRKWLIITPKQTTLATNIVIDEGAEKILFEQGAIEMHHQLITPDFKVPTASHIACIDASQIQFPLLLRRWKQGDYFYPLGMQKKKKVSRFFIDNKLSLADKAKVWVIEMDKKIVWIIGLRIDERFKITPSTKSIIRFTLTKQS